MIRARLDVPSSASIPHAFEELGRRARELRLLELGLRVEFELDLGASTLSLLSMSVLERITRGSKHEPRPSPP